MSFSSPLSDPPLSVTFRCFAADNSPLKVTITCCVPDLFSRSGDILERFFACPGEQSVNRLTTVTTAVRAQSCCILCFLLTPGAEGVPVCHRQVCVLRVSALRTGTVRKS